MIVRFWGVRGSIPTPLTPEEVRRKISAVVERITPQDLESSEAKERFLAHLPRYIFGTVGGNTTSIEVRLKDGNVILIDAGTGIFRFASSVIREQPAPKVFHLFFTHFHWDHIQGFPFFSPAFDKNVVIHIYSPIENVEQILRDQMKPPYFPITIDTMQAQFYFHKLEEPQVKIGAATVSWRQMQHPGSSFSYKVEESQGAFLFATDTELRDDDFARTEENRRFFSNVDILAIDSQYTLDEAIEKYDWGHSSYSLTVDFATEWDINTLVLFHHEPLYNDGKMFSIAQSAGWYSSHVGKQDVKILLAQEGLELSI